MLVAILAMAVVIDLGPSPDATLLVEQLGASRYASRIVAEGKLVGLGRASLPALRMGAVSKDAEIRARSAALLERIEGASLIEPTPIRFDLRQATLTEAIDEINRQSGFRISLAPERDAAAARRRVTLQSREPMTFWQAMDALCQAGGVRPLAELGGSPSPSGEGFSLGDGALAELGPSSDNGPFRVRLTSVHLQSEVRPGRSPEAASRDFFLQLSLVAEPRLAIANDGAARVTVALDDRGRSLMVAQGSQTIRRSSGYFGLSPASNLAFRLDLDYPEPEVAQLRLIRGVVPVRVETRKPNPLVIPLSSRPGQVFRRGEAELTLIETLPASPTQPTTIRVAIRQVGALAEPVDSAVLRPPGPRGDSILHRVEVLDAKGAVLPWFPSVTRQAEAETQVTMTVGRTASGSEPAALRFYETIQTKTEVGFEFRDVPIR
jgi:hypothetical protein